MTTKDFKKGVNEASQSFENKFIDQEKRVLNQVDNLSDKIDDVSNVMDEIIDIAEEQDRKINGAEKRRLYNVEEKTDIGLLEEYERKLLCGLIVATSNKFGKLNEKQQKFITSVFQYINIIEPDVNVTFEAVENIDNINIQKAILRVLMELMFLKNNNFNFMDNFEEVLQYFSINKKGISEIKEYIQKIYDIVGVQGLCEKYGYVEEIEEDSNDAEIERELMPLLISEPIVVDIDEILEFNYKDIIIEAPILCEGIIRFNNCKITIGDNINYDVSDDIKQYISNYSIVCLENSKLEICNSQINECSNFIDNWGGKIKISNCFAIDIGEYFFKDGSYGNSNIVIENTEFNNKNGINGFWVFNINNIDLEKCTFKGFNSKEGNIIYPSYSKASINISECLFFDCSNIIFDWISENNRTIIDNTMFQECKSESRLLQLSGEVEVRNCRFLNCSAENEERYSMAIIRYSPDSKNYKKCTIKKCEFKNINIIGAPTNYPSYISAIISAEGSKRGIECEVVDCIFDNCKSSNGNLINKYGTYMSMFGRIKEVQTINEFECKYIN